MNSSRLNRVVDSIVSVSDLLDYFIENPPVTSESAEESVRKVRIQGC